ncbi:GNAT family N-acetyltransferase [Nocardia pseudobrasiliensis]|uniref:RimJ/RimL family protein N-acetyltransferase n=1 Tax=Nocardia pseudobrasiliensis TaxID=45979 RepID=A0A370I8E8_9NOCA|nr:GNAT family N-acetyltransferase [Nocardia pseudobrasiliensis]RDI66982.1 RimJ/RimL family protein N-acetyltransferase [Nocardia pseudobrasiliensis]
MTNNASEPALPETIALCGNEIHLREWGDADIPAMVELFDENEVGRWTPLRSPFDEIEARNYLDRSRALRADGVAIQLAITTDARTPLGEILLFRTGSDAELAYAVGAAHRGRGLAASAVRLLTDYAYRELGTRHVLLRINSANAASVAVARATGFELTDDPVTVRGRSGPLRTWCHRVPQP